MKNSLETRLGWFFALAMVAAAIILEMLGGFDFFKGGLIVKARFKSVQELKVGDAVKMAGVRIGRVERVEFADDKVLVTMKITDKKAALKTDSRATIKFEGLMGQNYVLVGFGSPTGSQLGKGGDAELVTEEPPDLSELLGKLDGVATGIQKVTANFSDFNLTDAIMPFSDFLKESRPHMMGILTNANIVTERVRSGEGTIGMLINDKVLYNTALNTVSNLNDTATDVRGTLAAAKLVVADVTAGRGTLGRLVKDEKLYAETTDAMTNLKEIFQKINRGQGSVGQIVNDDALINNAKLTLQKLDKATEGLEDQGPLSLIGIAVGKLF